MKKIKVFGIYFIIIGLIFLILGTIKCITTFNKTDERIYATAKIVRIDEYETGDLEQPTGHRTYVEFEIAGKKTVSELNTYKSSFKLGKEIEIYYFNNDTDLVYQKGSEIFLILFTIIGIMTALLGVLLAFNKKLQIFLLKLPSSE